MTRSSPSIVIFFFFNDTATTEIYTLSLHDALPISNPRIYLREGPMSYSPILAVHICAGSLGLLSGTAAMSFRKGSPRHVLTGKVFVASMLTMAVVAVYLAIARHQPNNISGGALNLYFIRTGMLDAQRQG